MLSDHDRHRYVYHNSLAKRNKCWDGVLRVFLCMFFVVFMTTSSMIE
jgi:hypothetical protein